MKGNRPECVLSTRLVYSHWRYTRENKARANPECVQKPCQVRHISGDVFQVCEIFPQPCFRNLHGSNHASGGWECQYWKLLKKAISEKHSPILHEPAYYPQSPNPATSTSSCESILSSSKTYRPRIIFPSNVSGSQ